MRKNFEILSNPLRSPIFTIRTFSQLFHHGHIMHRSNSDEPFYCSKALFENLSKMINQEIKRSDELGIPRKFVSNYSAIAQCDGLSVRLTTSSLWLGYIISLTMNFRTRAFRVDFFCKLHRTESQCYSNNFNPNRKATWKPQVLKFCEIVWEKDTFPYHPSPYFAFLEGLRFPNSRQKYQFSLVFCSK